MNRRFSASPPGIAAVVLFALVCVIYAPGIGGGFVFDDFTNLVVDPDWKLASLDWAGFRRAAGAGVASDFGRPLAMLSFAFNYYFTGLDAAPMKATNITLHAVNAVLTFVLSLRVQRLAAGDRATGHRPVAIAALLAAVWALHPLLVSTVLYVVQRMEIAAHTFVLLSLLAYVRARRAQLDGQPAWAWFCGAGACMGVGCGFKETALLAPVYAGALEACVLGFRGRAGRTVRWLVAAYVGSALAAVVAFIGFVVPRATSAAAYATRDFDAYERLLTQLHAMLTYVRWIAWPRPDAYVFYYDNYPVSRALASPPATLAGLALILVLAAVAVKARRRAPLVSFGIAWFFIGHALTSNVIPLELVFEHRNYAASFGLLLAGVDIVSRAAARLNLDAQASLALVAVVACASLTSIQVHTWGQPFRLALSLESRNTTSPRATYELGRLMLAASNGDTRSPMWDLARKEFEHGTSLPSASPLPYQALIIMLASSGQPVDARHWRGFRAALTRRTIDPQGEAALHEVIACREQGRCRFDDNDLFQTILAVVARNPDSPSVLTQYATFAFGVMRDGELAVRLADAAAAKAPQDMQYAVNVAKLLAATGRDPRRLAVLMTDLQRRGAASRYPDDFREIRSLLQPRPGDHATRKARS